ncbi:BspA family leucine-rich repeat surface protein [Aquimarina agarivorans]|uniref:BspA family leucine-rich repeat surface protein n=1 Tax=Aquimarina agarivorans TaxID=980584 RepID=UPI000248E8C2|nr:BspA family leucine-rich repeat surface protein [Aquimarina agarivorans]
MKKLFLPLFLFFTSMLLAQTNPDAFVFKYNITNANQAISFDVGASTKAFDYNVDWGDGTTDTNLSALANHTYTTPGEYTVSITGVFPILKFSLNPIISIEQWGTNEWESCESMFGRNRMLTSINATDIPNFAPSASLQSMFIDCEQLEANINNWDVSNVTNMSGMFLNAFKFNSPLDKWDVSNVTLMSAMFNNAEAFNQPINNWNVSNVTDMTSMFQKAENFNTSINDWNVSKVTSMANMFREAENFNQPLGKWNVSKVTNMQNMFRGELLRGKMVFNQPLNTWDVSNVTDMSTMFGDAEVFNQPLNNWDVSKVADMSSMFGGAKAFNQNINSWTTTSLKDTRGMFFKAEAFNQPLDNWDVSKVTDMRSMFSETKVFNQNINSWNTGSLKNVSSLFESAEAFNQPLDNWDLSNISSIEYEFVFNGATAFDQPLENWYPRQGSGVRFMPFFLNNSGMSSANYTKTLIAWSKAPDILDNSSERFGFIFQAEGINYCDEAILAIQILEDDLNWSVRHGDLDPDCTGPTLSTFDFDTENSNSMFYNYNNDTLDIVTEKNTNLTIYDLLGREVMVKEVESGATSQNLRELLPAVYIAKLENHATGNSKLIKIILN